MGTSQGDGIQDRVMDFLHERLGRRDKDGIVMWWEEEVDNVCRGACLQAVSLLLLATIVSFLSIGRRPTDIIAGVLIIFFVIFAASGVMNVMDGVRDRRKRIKREREILISDVMSS